DLCRHRGVLDRSVSDRNSPPEFEPSGGAKCRSTAGRLSPPVRRLVGVCGHGAASDDCQSCTDGLAAAPRLSAAIDHPLKIERTPNTISDAIENNNNPPAIRNAASEICSVSRSQSPIRVEPARIAPAMMLARTATLRRAVRGSPSVIARKVGVRPTGSTTTNKVRKAETA